MDEDGMLRTDIRSNRERGVSDEQPCSGKGIRYRGAGAGREEDGGRRQYQAYHIFRQRGGIQCGGYYQEYDAVRSFDHEYERSAGSELFRRHTGERERERRFRYYYRSE